MIGIKRTGGEGVREDLRNGPSDGRGKMGGDEGDVGSVHYSFTLTCITLSPPKSVSHFRVNF